MSEQKDPPKLSHFLGFAYLLETFRRADNENDIFDHFSDLAPEFVKIFMLRRDALVVGLDSTMSMQCHQKTLHVRSENACQLVRIPLVDVFR